MAVTERKEKEIRKKYIEFLRRSCVPEGNPELVEMKIMQMADELFEMFMFFSK